MGASASPAFADADGDGDLDLFIGNNNGDTLFFRNTANPGATAPAYAAATTNPFGIGDVGYNASPAFADADADGDLDLFIGERYGCTLFFRNTATAGATAPAYAEAATNPFGISDVGVAASPAFADADGDGDLDLFIGNNAGDTLLFRNIAAATPVAPVSSTTTNGSYGIGAVISLSLQFSEAVYVNTSGGIPRLQLETGAIDRYASYSGGSGTNTLSFSYTVQAGDSSADLDQLSSSALELNGGTIQDAAGNNATLTLAAPGANGSLAANAALVIDTMAPTAPSLALASDTGLSNSDGITNIGTINVSGLEAGASWQYSINGGSSWSTAQSATTTSFSLTPGNYVAGSVLVRQSDIAGNTSINGQLAAVTIDTTAPTGSLGSSATAPAYAAAATNPFGISDVGASASPAFADADGDGDLDLFISERYGCTLFFRNTASAGATAPAYATASTNPFDIGDVGSWASPAFADADADGDLDLFIGELNGDTLFFRNNANPGATAPAYAAAATNPFGISDVGASASPAFADADGDGDLDLFIGNNNGDTLFFRNTANPGATAPAYAAATTNPFGIGDVGYNASPAFADADADGDLDLFIGERYGCTLFFRNTATAGATAPAYAEAATNPFGISDVGVAASPAFADADGDGDLDLFIGNNAGDTLLFRNIAAATPVAPVSSTTTNGSYGIGAVISLSLQFSEAVYVNTSGGIPRLQLETGAIDRYASYSGGSGTNTLSFSYTVQAGDSSADLDQLSSSALELNGGTIQDAAGNNATLTLAAPGANGSLAANAALVIDTMAPTAPSLALASDSGISNSDGITNIGTINVSGLETGASWQYSTNSGGSWSAAQSATTTSFSLTPGNYVAGSILVRQSDIAGNTSINGQLAAVTIDTTAPTGSLKPTAPGYAAPSTNPFGITDAGAWASPSFADIDSDGDLDLFIGNYQGNTLFYRNTAATGSTSPAYATPSINPFGLADVGDSAKPSLVDIDGDGDLDLFIGETYGNTLFYRNTAAAGSTSPAYAAASTNAFGITNVGYSARPSFADIDKDGDLDLFIGNSEGNILFYRNTAAAGATAPSYAVASVNPFGIANAGDNASPGFADIDGDGDLDLLIGNGEGKTLVYRNNAIATATTPAFGAPSTNPFGITNASGFANPSLVDIDSDGDLDLFIGIDNGNMMFSRNIAARDPVAPLIPTTTNGSYKVGDVISFTLQFSKAIYVTTTGGNPRLQLETGAIDRYAVYSGGSGTDTLSFSYTVQAGDSSADLDQVSSNALELNGGSIRDIAGNNAILTLAAPGAPGSLAANGALVIDGISPAVTSVVATGSGISGGSGNLKAGKVVTITVNTSERVISYGGTPSLSLNSGGIATYASGGGTNSLVFTYTVVAGENADDLRITGLNANGATISDLVGNSFVSFSNNPAGLLVIDTTMPTIIAKPDASNTVIITTNEAGTAGFYKSDNSQFLSDTVSANTNKSFTFAAQAAIASLTLRATDLAENLTTSTSSFLLGTTLDDLLTGTNSDDFIYGFAGQDTLAGGGGNDILDGGVGADSLTGGTGNDQYYVDNAGDLVIEQASGGNDLVYSSIDYTLGSNVENLTLTGSASLIGTGNSLDNEITGNSGNNSLSGGGGSDTIDGGSGADTLIGGIGDDQYYVDNVNDQVIEQASAGTDLVYSSIDYALGGNVERLVLTGSTSLNGTGNGLNNIITGNSGNNSLSGNAGNDTLNGGLGADTLTGGSGSDRFLFTTLNNSLLASFDRIMDFSIGTDVLRGPNAVTAANINKLGTVSALDSPSISSLLTNTSFLASRAATFSYADPAGFSRSFIAINDASAGFSASTDAIVEITGYTGSLNNLQIV